MHSRLTLKDSLLEVRLFQERAVWALVAVLMLLAVVLGRLFYLQVISHDHYTTLSRNNRVKLVPIAPTRGLIYDRNGVILAHNVPSFSLELVPEQVADQEATLAALGELVSISPADVDRFKEQVRRRRRFESVPLRFRLTEEEVSRFAVNRHRFPGVDIVARLARRYPLGSLTAHSVGYVGRINEDELRRLSPSNYSGTSHVGKVGVEKFYEERLHGQVGHQQVEINAAGRVLRVLARTAPTPGHNLYLHLDSRLQAAATRALGEHRGSIVAMDTSTGGILALVSLPAYDPNPFVNGIEPKAYRALQRAAGRPLFNRALRGRYPPGSTIKPFVALAGLETGVITANRKTYCPGWYSLPGDEHKYRCWKRTGHGHVDLTRSIVESCDVFFYDLALTLGIDRLHDFLARFGFGHQSGIDISGERAGLLPSRQWKRAARGQPWYPGETLITGIGQGFMLVTPVQIANATAALARTGTLLPPRMLYATSQQDSSVLEVQHAPQHEPIPIAEAENWHLVRHGMEEVVHGPRGTARRIGKDAPVRIAGKTGTAQLFGLAADEKYDKDQVPEKLRDHALFIAFAPVEAPRIAVAVVVENGGSGGAVAAPIARQVIDAYLEGEQR